LAEELVPSAPGLSIRRFTRLTNAFSKKLENHEAAVALHFMHHNFARSHLEIKLNNWERRGMQWIPKHE